MNFDMDSQQIQAFRDATGGVSYLTFNHVILFLIGSFATIWLVGVFFGTWTALQNHRIELGDAMFKFGAAMLVFICVGSMIFFHA
jgi:hypothetical protein